MLPPPLPPPPPPPPINLCLVHIHSTPHFVNPLLLLISVSLPWPPLNPSLPVLISASLCLERVQDSRFYQCYGLKLAHVPPTPYTYTMQPPTQHRHTHTHPHTLLPFHCTWSHVPATCIVLGLSVSALCGTLSHTLLKQIFSLPYYLHCHRRGLHFQLLFSFSALFSPSTSGFFGGHCFTIVAEWDDQRWWKVFAKHKHAHAGLPFNRTGKTTVIRISALVWACFTVRIFFFLFFPSSLWWLGLYNGHRDIYCNI